MRAGSRARRAPGPSTRGPESAISRYDRKDHFHQRAQREGYRSRAAYKLLEIQQAQRLLAKGQRVVDLGCWPGGWLQVAVRAVGPGGRVAGVDKAATDPFEEANVLALQGDLEDAAASRELLAFLGGPADVVLSDAAPKLTGQRDVDNAACGRLLEAVEAALPALLRPGGALLVKLLESPDSRRVEGRLAAAFEHSKRLKTKATRKGSSERYLLARGFSPPGSV